MDEEEREKTIVEIDELIIARKRSVEKLLTSIKQELDILKVKIQLSRTPEKTVTIGELISESRTAIASYDWKVASEDLLDALQTIIARLSNVIAPRILEPFRQATQIFKEQDIIIDNLNKKVRKLEEDLAHKEKVVPKDSKEEPNISLDKDARDEIATWREKFIAEKITGREFTTKKSISGFVNGHVQVVKRSKIDLWRMKVINELGRELIKKHGFDK